MKEKKKMQDYINFANHKGITLLVLVITIIVMMILAGVTIAISMNDDGIINKTISALDNLEVSEEKDTLAVAHSALLMRQELYDAEITAGRLEDKINESGREAIVYKSEDEEGILFVRFKKTGHIYKVNIENGAIEFKGTNRDKKDEVVIHEEDILFAINPDGWTNENVITTITVDHKINMSDYILQWTKTPEDKKSWQNYEEGTKITSEKKETIYARIREKNTDQTKARNQQKIEKIDKNKPTGTLAVESITTNKATVKVTANDEPTEEYGASGIKGYYYSKDNGATWSQLTKETTYEFTKLTQTNEYKFKVKIEDNAGNTDVFGTDGTTETVPTPTDADLKHTITWSGTNATVTFTTTAGFWIQTSIDGTNWVDTNPVTVPSGATIYVRYSDSEDITEEGSNKGPQYAAVKPLWTGTVSYDANTGTGAPSAQRVEHTKTATVSFTNKPAKTGYTFTGWNTKADGTGTSYTENGTKTFTMGTTDVTLYAQWTANTYTVTYNGNGKTGGSTANSSHTYDVDKVLTTNGYTKKGHTFAGWNTKADGTGTAYGNGATVKNLSSTAGATVTLYAQWTANTYKTTIDPNGGTFKYGLNTTATDRTTAINGSFIYGTPTARVSGTTTSSYDNSGSGIPSLPWRTGYTFDGWEVINGAKGSVTIKDGWYRYSADNPGDVTIRAKWKVNTYTIYFSANGGTGGPTSMTRTYGQSVTFPTTAPTKTGYTFQGWTYYSTGNTSSTATSTATSGTYKSGATASASASGGICWTANDTTYVATWSPNTYTVTLDNRSATTAGTQKCYYQYNTTQTINNVTCYYYTNNTCTSGLTNGYTIVKPTKTGYTFGGYYTGTSGSGTQYVDANGNFVNNRYKVVGNVTLYAKWTANTYSVKFAGGGSGVTLNNTNSTQTFDSTYFTIKVPSKIGCEFTGWKITGDYNSSTAKKWDGSSKWVAFSPNTGCWAQKSDETLKDICSTNNGTVTFTAQWKDVAGPTISVSKDVASDKYSATLSVSATDYGSGVKSLKYYPGNRSEQYMSENGINVSGTISVKLNARYFLDAHNTTTLNGKDLTECSYTFYAIDNAGFSTTYNYKLTDLLLEVYFTGRNGLEVTNGGGSYGGSINSSNGVITIDDKISGSTQHGPYVTLPAGTYDVAWWGSDWGNVGFDISTSTSPGDMTTLKDGSNTYSNYFAFSGWRISNKTSRIELRCRGKKTKGSGTTTVEKILLKQTSK